MSDMLSISTSNSVQGPLVLHSDMQNFIVKQVPIIAQSVQAMYPASPKWWQF